MKDDKKKDFPKLTDKDRKEIYEYAMRRSEEILRGRENDDDLLFGTSEIKSTSL